MDYFGQFGSNRQQALTQLLPYIERMLQAHYQADYIRFMSLATRHFKLAVSPVNFFNAHQKFAATLGKPLQLNLVNAFELHDNPVLVFDAQYERSASKITVHVEFCNQTLPPKINYLTIE